MCRYWKSTVKEEGCPNDTENGQQSQHALAADSRIYAFTWPIQYSLDLMQPYRAFLLTCWQEETAGADSHMWRFRLEEPRTGEQRGFTTLEEVMAFVQSNLIAAKDDEGDGFSGLK
jgi:hypothetical protein